MGPAGMLRQLIQSHGEEFEIKRGGQVVGTARGVRNHETTGSRRAYLGFMPETEIQEGDHLHGKVSDENFHISKIEKQLWAGKVSQIKALYGSPPSGHSHSAINIGNMTNSVIQSNSPGAIQTVTFNQTQTTEIREIATGLREALDRLGLGDEQRGDLEAETDTLDAQLKKSKPNASVIRACLESAKGILESVAGEAASGAAAALALELLHRIAPLLT
jgi:hypothetical protein